MSCRLLANKNTAIHYSHIIMSAVTSQISGVLIVHSTVCSGADQRKQQFCVADLCEGNSPVTAEFPTQRASNGENVFIWWRHHGQLLVTKWYSKHFAISLIELTYTSNQPTNTWNVYKLCIWKCYKNWNKIFFSLKKISIHRKYIFLENTVDTDPQHVKANLDVTGYCLWTTGCSRSQ